MIDFFAAFYEFFGEHLGLFKIELLSELRGNVCSDDKIVHENYFTYILMALFLVNILFKLNYYKGLFDQVPFNKFWVWLLNVIVSSLIVAMITYTLSYNTLDNHCADFNYDSNSCFGISVTSFIYSFLLCFLLSIGLKHVSKVNKKIPF